MHEGFPGNPAFGVALALAAGVAAQLAARHLRVPGIVILLGAGVLLGPDAAGLIRPEDLGPALEILTGFAVAVILFEGGLNLDRRRIRAEAASIRLLISVGLLITLAGAAVSAKLALGWDWRTSLLFGSLVTVTGPTVITPLLRRIRVRRAVETVLEAEGVFIDGVGAIVAVVALEIAIAPGGSSLLSGAASIPGRLIAGAVFGLVAGGLLAVALRNRRLVPEGFRNILVLSSVLALFQAANALVRESGIVAVIAAGLVLGNIRTPLNQELREFKEELTVLLIGMLFVLLAADVRAAEVAALGYRGLLVAALLIFVVRPLNVAVCTAGSSLSARERIFVAWMGPRGIVAAAVASLFADRLAAAGLPGGAQLRAEVFLVIAVTVVFLGVMAGPMARLLQVRRPAGRGYVILGAHALGRTLARLLKDAGHETVLLDSNVMVCREAEAEGHRVILGNALEERVLLGARVESRRAVLSTLCNEAIGLLFARRAMTEQGAPAAAVAIQVGAGSVDPQDVREAGAAVLFGQPVDIELWDVRIRRGMTAIHWLKQQKDRSGGGAPPESEGGRLMRLALPLVLRREDATAPLDDRFELRTGDRIAWLVHTERSGEAIEKLADSGWIPAADAPAPGEN